jgi:hypothetical protein
MKGTKLWAKATAKATAKAKETDAEKKTHAKEKVKATLKAQEHLLCIFLAHRGMGRMRLLEMTRLKRVP